MKNFFRKTILPWLAADCFDDPARYCSWLQRLQRLYGNLRMVLIVLAVVPLLIGYIVDRHSIMLLTILPLVLVLLLSVALERISGVLDGQNNQ